MGAICSCCCEPIQEYNPDGSPKPLQTKEQMKNDPPDLRKAAKACDLEAMQPLLERMLVKQICSGAKNDEVEDAEVGMTALHYSAQENHLRGAVKLLLYGANMEARDARGYTPLHTQMELGYRKVAQFLMNKGADLNAQDKTGATPLMVALHNSQKGALELVLKESKERISEGKAGLDLTHISEDGWSYALILAKLGWWSDLDHILGLMKPSFENLTENPEAASTALKSLNVRSNTGDTVLGWVLRYTLSGALNMEESLALVKCLLTLGVSASTPAFSEDVPPIALAVAIGDQELWDTIKKTAGDHAVCAKDGLKRSLLHYASAKGHLDFVKQLSSSLRVDEADKHGNTPLHLAALKGHPECVRELLEQAAANVHPDPKKTDLSAVEFVLLQRNADGLAVIHLALQAGPMPKAQLAALEGLSKLTDAHLQAKSNVATKEGFLKETPLTLAVTTHQHAVVKSLLERGLDVNTQTSCRETALMRCLASVTRETASLDVAIFKLLIDAGASLNVGEGNEANHPLLSISSNDCNEFAQLALKILAEKSDGGYLDWDVVNPENGQTPLMVAALHNNSFIVQTIMKGPKAQKMMRKKCNEGLTALCYASWGSSVDAMKVLLNNRANVEHKDKNGNPVMSFCLRLDVPDSLVCAALLLRCGARPCKHKDVSGEGLLHRAVRYGAADFLRLWVRYGGSVEDQCTSPIQANLVVPTARKYDPKITGKAARAESEDAQQDDNVLDQDYMPAEPVEEYEEDDEGLDDLGDKKGTQGAPNSEHSSSKADQPKTETTVPAHNTDVKGTVGAPRLGGHSTSGKKSVAVAEGVEGGDLGDLHWGRDASGFLHRVPSFFSGPSAVQLRKWAKQGSSWWNDWIDQDQDPANINQVYGNPDDEDWNLEDRDGVLTMDDLLFEITDRLKNKKSTDAGAVCEGMMDGALSSLKKASSAGLGKIVPIGGDKLEEALAAAGEDLHLVPDSLDKHHPDVGIKLARSLYLKRFEKEGINMNLEPFYQPESAYEGEPMCMKADVSSMEPQIPQLVESMYERLAGYDIKPETPLQGADLRERNIRCWISSLSPESFPLKLGRWLSIPGKTEEAVRHARARVAPTAREMIRKRTAFIGQPDLPTFPELEGTTALTYAVQLCRPACVKALLEGDLKGKLLNAKDLYGHTALEYAMSMLARDRNNLILQQIVDQLLVRRPIFERASSPAYHNPMHPLCLAILAVDFPRIAWMVCCCGAPLDASYIYAPDVPCHYQGLWEKMVGSTEAVFGPLHLALLHKRVDIAKLLLDLGADPNVNSWGLGAGIFSKSVFTKREDFLELLLDKRVDALRGKGDNKDSAALQLRSKQLEESRNNIHIAYKDLKGEHKSAVNDIAATGKKWLASQTGNFGMALQGITAIIKKIMDLIKDLIGGPDPWVSPLHLAARYGQSDLCVLLLNRGATVNGGSASVTARRTPLEESLQYARSNFRFDNCGALRHNWLQAEKRAKLRIPPMSAAAVARQANSKMNKLAKLSNPIVLGAKAGIMASKIIITMLLDSFKRPIAHYDPALKATHVLARHHALMKPNEAQTNILLRDLIDNGTWAWIGGGVGRLEDARWLRKLDDYLDHLALDCKLREAETTADPKTYEKYVADYKRKFNSKYFSHGTEEFEGLHHYELHAAMLALIPALQTTKGVVSAKANRFYMEAAYARSQLKFKGLEWNIKVKQELKEAVANAKDNPPVFEEPSLLSDSPLQPAGFDLEDEDIFLGGAREAISRTSSRGTSIKCMSLSRKSSRSSASMAANAPPFSVPSFRHETPQNALGISSADAAMQMLQVPPMDVRAVFSQTEPADLEACKEKAKSMQAETGGLMKKVMEARDDYEKQVQVTQNALEASKQAHQAHKAMKDDDNGDEEGIGGEPNGGSDGGPGGDFEGAGNDMDLGDDDIDTKFEGFGSLQESLDSLNDDADLDVNGLCAMVEEFQEVIDQIVDIVEDVI